MEITFDPAKNDRNIALCGLSFELAAELDWQSALIWRDERRDYGEKRYCALVPLHGKVYSIVFTTRGDALRVISFRKANSRERNRYEEEKA